MSKKCRERVQPWETILARVCVFGFEVLDDGSDVVEVKRNGRSSFVDLVGTIDISGSDPRDVWLLKRAIGDSTRWDAVETYFVRRDDGVYPVELRLSRFIDGTPILDHDGLDGSHDRIVIRKSEDLQDALLPLAASNTIGYHCARERILKAYERIRPKMWLDVGISNSALIAEYENYYVTPDDVAQARTNGRGKKNDIIAEYGLPSLKWIDDEHRSDQ